MYIATLTHQDKRSYLDVISRYFDVHATIGDTTQKKQNFNMSIIPGFVYNHGILKTPDLQALLWVCCKWLFIHIAMEIIASRLETCTYNYMYA